MAGIWQRFISICFVFSIVMITAVPARAVTILRDPDIEYGLRQLAAPLITAAGLSPSRINILVVQDSSLNAFVVDTKTIFLHSGLILKLKTPEELQAVLAHELAHIANGHITRRQANQRTAGGAARFGLLLAAIVGAATENPSAAAGIAAGTASSATRVFLGHTRAEEASADQSALRYMSRAGIDPTAMSRVLDLFRGQELLNAVRQDPYIRSHPLNRDRIRAVAGYAAAYKTVVKNDPNAAYWFSRVKGKLGAFLQAPGFTQRKLRGKDMTDVNLMRRAVAHHRGSDSKKALADINSLTAKRPKDPFYLELKGQILLESRQYAAAETAYARAVQLAPQNALILAGHGRSLLALNSGSSNARALKVLVKARSRDARDPRLMRDLATAYARAGQRGNASLVTAERYALVGDFKSAAIHAKRAADLLPNGSPGWNRAQDVLTAAKTSG